MAVRMGDKIRFRISACTDKRFENGMDCPAEVTGRVIAQAAGCCPTTVAKWRRRTGRPANRKGRTNHAKTENSEENPG